MVNNQVGALPHSYASIQYAAMKGVMGREEPFLFLFGVSSKVPSLISHGRNRAGDSESMYCECIIWNNRLCSEKLYG